MRVQMVGGGSPGAAVVSSGGATHAASCSRVLSDTSTVRLLVIALFALVLFVPGRAAAYRTLADLPNLQSKAAVAWPGAVLRFDVSTADLPSNLDAEGVATDVVSSLGAWQGPACASLAIEYRGIVSQGAVLGDSRNTIQFVTSGWTQRGYAHDQAGVTEVDYARIGDGPWFVSEADMFINAEDFTWGPEGRPLSSLFTHEGGHVLGLLHPCENGQPGIPDCRDGGFTDRAMYPFYDPARVELSDDDIAAICFLYPRAAQIPNESFACSADVDCGPGQQCGDSGQCQTIVNAVGGACHAPSDCITGLCDPNGTCGTGPGRFGAVCADSNDCESAQCLVGGTTEPVCTQLCGGPVRCPANWECRGVEGRDVCAPVGFQGAGGCSYTSPRANHDSLAGLILMTLLVGARRRRAPQRARRVRSRWPFTGSRN
jgi:hypothetical protein